MYAVIPMRADARIVYPDDLCDAMAIYYDIAQTGQAVALGQRHEGNDKPHGYYDTIQRANM